MNKDWIKETSGLLEDWEAQEQVLRNKYEQLANELMDMRQRITTGHELIRDYMIKHKIDSVTPDNIKVGNLTNKSYPQMLIEIAKQSDGILNISDTTDILFEANIGRDKKQIRHNIDTALARSREHFVKIGRGQYRFTNHIQDKKGKESSGLRQTIKELKERNPQMTKQEVLRYLQETKFDFKGKRETSAVNITWAKLGYFKENKQQSLLEIK